MTLAAHLVVVLDEHITGDELEIRYRADGGLWFQGNAKQVIATLRRLQLLGVSHFSLDPTTVDERGTPGGRARALEIVAREVFPAFK